MGQDFDRSPISKLLSVSRSDNNVKKVLADFDCVWPSRDIAQALALFEHSSTKSSMKHDLGLRMSLKRE
jgi:hypothetical protein